MLGSSGRFFEQLARQQEESEVEQQALQMAQQVQQINPLDPGYTAKVQALASRNPMAFNSPMVRQAMTLGELARKEQEDLAAMDTMQRGQQMAESLLQAPLKGFSQTLAQAAKTDIPAFKTPLVQEALDVKKLELSAQKEKREAKQEKRAVQTKAMIASADAETLEKLSQEAPQFLPDIEKRMSELTEIETIRSQLPVNLHTPENLSRVYKAQRALNEFNRKLPAPLQKVQSFEQRLMAAEQAEEYIKQLDQIPAEEKKPGKISQSVMALADLRNSVIANLDLDPDRTNLPDEMLRRIAKAKEVLAPEVPLDIAPERVKAERLQKLFGVSINSPVPGVK
jgi:hypothetical protein